MYANGNFHHVTLIFNVILIIYFALCDFNVMETLFIELDRVGLIVQYVSSKMWNIIAIIETESL